MFLTYDSKQNLFLLLCCTWLFGLELRGRDQSGEQSPERTKASLFSLFKITPSASRLNPSHKQMRRSVGHLSCPELCSTLLIDTISCSVVVWINEICQPILFSLVHAPEAHDTRPSANNRNQVAATQQQQPASQLRAINTACTSQC